MEVVASLSQGRTAAAQCGLFTHKSVPVIFEPPCNMTSPVSVVLGKTDTNTATQGAFGLVRTGTDVFHPSRNDIVFGSTNEVALTGLRIMTAMAKTVQFVERIKHAIN